MRKVWPLLLLFTQTALAQNKILDSLELQFSAAKNDESRLAVLKELVNTAFEIDLNKAMEYARKGVALTDKAEDKNTTCLLRNERENILDSFGADKKVQIECVMDKLNIDIDTAVPLGLIVN